MLFELTLLATFALHHLLIGGVLLLILDAAIRCLKLSAELQSWLWVTAFVVSTMVPLSSFVQSAPAPIPSIAKAETLPPSEEAPSLRSGAVTSDSPTGVEKRIQWNVPSSFVFLLSPVFYVFLLIWLVGSCWRLVSIARSYIATMAIVSSCKSLEGSFSGVLETLGQIDIKGSAKARTPMTVGLLRPAILVPKSFLERFDAEALLPILLHEYAHIRRRDLWVCLFQEALAVVFWWSPVMRMLNRRIHVSRELACDAWAARRLSDRRRYAQSLVDCAHLMLERRCNVLAMGLFSKKKELTFRVNKVLNMNIDNRTKPIRYIAACLLVSTSAILAAQEFAPQVNLESVRREANYFSELSRAKGELLMEAIRKEDAAMVKFMISNGLDINTPIQGDGTALIVAVKYGKRDMVEELISLGADVNQAARGDGNPLIAAAMYNRVEIAEFLVLHGANIDDVVQDDESALINASRRGHYALVRFLVENGADVNLGVNVEARKDGESVSEYRSPLNMAGSNEVREYLLRKGANR